MCVQCDSSAHGVRWYNELCAPSTRRVADGRRGRRRSAAASPPSSPCHDRLPRPSLVVVLGVLGAWYGSLQHEVIHGHPTPWRPSTRRSPSRPLGLVVPFSDLPRHPPRPPPVAGAHRRRARSRELPRHARPTWARCGPCGGARCGCCARSPAGWCSARCVAAVGAAVELGLGARTPCRRRSPPRPRRPVSAVVLPSSSRPGWRRWVYVVGVAWVGGALTLLRSFAEHRWTDDGSAVGGGPDGPVMALLYLNNNLHHTHHDRPGAPWYRAAGRAPRPRRRRQGGRRSRAVRRLLRRRSALPGAAVRQRRWSRSSARHRRRQSTTPASPRRGQRPLREHAPDGGADGDERRPANGVDPLVTLVWIVVGRSERAAGLVQQPPHAGRAGDADHRAARPSRVRSGPCRGVTPCEQHGRSSYAAERIERPGPSRATVRRPRARRRATSGWAVSARTSIRTDDRPARLAARRRRRAPGSGRGGGRCSWGPS